MADQENGNGMRKAARRKELASDEELDLADLPIHAMPGHLIRRLQQAAVGLFLDEIEGTGIEVTPVQYGALKAVQMLPGIDQATLARVIAQDRATIGGVIDRLEAKAYLERFANELDRRVWRLRILPDGERIIAELDPAVARAQQRILAPLKPRDREIFLDLVRKIVDGANEFSRVPMRPIAPVAKVRSHQAGRTKAKA